MEETVARRISCLPMDMQGQNLASLPRPDTEPGSQVRVACMCVHVGAWTGNASHAPCNVAHVLLHPRLRLHRRLCALMCCMQGLTVNNATFCWSTMPQPAQLQQICRNPFISL